RKVDTRPLTGLHIALDPGHVGGRWAKYEGRDFVIEDSDYRVREGELVLEVAQRVRSQLLELGAEVTLLREGAEPINPKPPLAYLELAARQIARPKELNFETLLDYGYALRDRSIHLSVVTGEIAERARVVNEVIQPDAFISLHINAAPWPLGDAKPGEQAMALGRVKRLVKSNHVHVLVFGCMSRRELSSPRQQEQFVKKFLNGSAAMEHRLGRSLGEALIEASGLNASSYEGENAIRMDVEAPVMWARNLMLLRTVECPTVLLEPYVANSEAVYSRIQSALHARATGAKLPDNDILLEYTDAVVSGVRAVYE
ncbi:MAG TPA: hypothetical protein DCX06_01370, partial [Opitutae bacterium]|nr:hypothetical protein [Opitutae bacterium]